MKLAPVYEGEVGMGKDDCAFANYISQNTDSQTRVS